MSFLTPQVIKTLEQRQESKWITAGGVTLLFYDAFLTMDLEIRHVWPARWSIGKTLFYLQRTVAFSVSIASFYMAVSNDDSPHFCKMTQDLSGYGTAAVTATVQLAMVVRIWALYQRSRRVLTFLILLYLATNSTTLIVYSLLTRHISYHPNALHGIVTLCYLECADCRGAFVNIYTPILVFDLTAVLMIVRQAYVAREVRAFAPTLAILYRDGIIYFLVLSAAVLTNMLFLSVANGVQQSWFVPFMRTLTSAMASRILLNIYHQMDRRPTRIWLNDLKEVANLKVDDTFVTPSVDSSHMVFKSSEFPDSQLEPYRSVEVVEMGEPSEGSLRPSTEPSSFMLDATAPESWASSSRRRSVAKEDGQSLTGELVVTFAGEVDRKDGVSIV